MIIYNFNTINEQNFSNNSYIKSQKLIKNEQEEEMWKHILKNGESKQYHIGLISDENKLNFIFKSLENKEYKKVKYQTKINVKELINRLANNNDFKMSDDMLMFAIKNFDIFNKDLELENKEWELILKKTDISFLQHEVKNKIVERLNEIAWRPDSKTKQYGYDHENRKIFIENFVEPYIKVSANHKKTLGLNLLNTIVDLMLEGGIPKISDESLKTLIKDSDETYHVLRYLLEHEQKIERLNEKSQKTDINYLNYISKENAELIIEKANKDRISLELLYISYKNNQIELKELRQKLYDKILIDPKDYIKVHLNVKDNPFSKDLINEKIKEISQDKRESESLLSYWIENFYIKNNQKLKDEEILLLIDSLKGKDNNFLYERRYDSGVINRAELGYKLLEIVKEASVDIKIKEKQDLPFLKEILNKSKNTNEFLLNYYLDKSLENFLNISEEELIKYVKESKTNAYKECFFKQCFDINTNNKKLTGGLLNFAISLVDISEENKNILQKWFYHIRSNKVYDVYEKIKKEDIEELINNEKLLKIMAPTILISIKHIEDRWNIKIDKEKIIKKIDFNKISYEYEELVDIEEITKEKLMKKELIDNLLWIEDFDITKSKFKINRKKIINFWEKIINQKNRNGEPTFSTEEIGKMLSEIRLIYPHMRSLVMETMFGKKEILVKEIIETVSINKDVEEKNIKNLDFNNQSFIEDLLKRDVKVFENFAEEIIKYCGNNEVIQDEQQKDKEITTFTKCLLTLKAEVDFDENLLLKAYSRSRVKEIDGNLIKKAKIVSLMSEEELNDIDIAYDLVKRNKNNFYKLGKQIVEFLQLDTDNSEKLLNKYSEENVKGLMGYFKRKEKSKLQEKINEAIKYNKEKLNNNSMQINFANLFNEIILRKTWNEEEKISLKEIVKRVKSFLEKNLYARKFLKDVNAHFLQSEKENFTKEDIEEIIQNNPNGVSDILFENLLNRKTNIYGENGLYWLQKIMERNQENYKFEAGIKEKHLISYYEKTKYIQDEPIWKHLYNILKLNNYDDNITPYKHFFEVITKENKEDLLKQDKFGNNILTILLKDNHYKLKITSKDFSDTCDYIINEYDIDEFKKLINNKNHTSLMPEYKDKNHILLNILKQSLTQERKEILISYLDKDIINDLNQEQIERVLNGNNISIKSINYILETRKEKEDVILEILVKKYRKEISKDILKEQYKKEIKYNNIENLLNTTLTNTFIKDSFFKEENIALVEKIRDIKDIKKKREYIKIITNQKGYNLENALKIIEVLKDEKQESPYENYFINFIMQQSEKEQEVVAREIIKDNKNISLVVRLLVSQKYKEVNLSQETQEIIVNRVLDVNQNKILIDILFEDLYNKKQTQSNYGNIIINKELTEKVINNYIEEKDTSVNGLLAIILNEKSVKNFQLSEELKIKIKENLDRNMIEGKFFNKLEEENKKDKEKIKSMFKKIYVDEFYINKQEKIKTLEKIANEKTLEKITSSWAKKLWHEEIIVDVVNYSINDKEILKELLKTNNVIKEMVIEEVFSKVIEHKYWINKVGENTVKEVINYIANEYKSRNRLEEIMFSTISKENKNNNKKDLFIPERDASNSNAYLDLINIGSSKKELNKVITDKFQFFAEVLIKNIVECINNNQLEEETIKKVFNRYITLKIIQDNMQEVEETYLKLNNKYKNNIDIINKVIGQINPTKIWEHIGDEIKEKFDLNENNIIKKLEKYNEENTDGIFGYINKIKKEKIQKEIDNMVNISEMEKWNIKKWINKGNNIKKYLNEEEAKQLNEVQEEVGKIGQLGVKNLSSYAKQELKKLSEQLLEDIGKDEFLKKARDLKEKVQNEEKEVKENIKMEIKKEMAIIIYKS